MTNVMKIMEGYGGGGDNVEVVEVMVNGEVMRWLRW